MWAPASVGKFMNKTQFQDVQRVCTRWIPTRLSATPFSLFAVRCLSCFFFIFPQSTSQPLNHPRNGHREGFEPIHFIPQSFKTFKKQLKRLFEIVYNNNYNINPILQLVLLYLKYYRNIFEIQFLHSHFFFLFF